MAKLVLTLFNGGNDAALSKVSNRAHGIDSLEVKADSLHQVIQVTPPFAAP